MNRLLTVTLVAWLVLYNAPLDAQNPPTLIWDYETATDPLCSAQLTDDCVTSFDLFYYDSNGVPVTAVRVQASAGQVLSGSVWTWSLPVPQVPGRRYVIRRWFVRAIALSGGIEIVSEKSNELDVQQRPTPPRNLHAGS